MSWRAKSPATAGVALLLLFLVGLFGVLVGWLRVIWFGLHDLGHQHYVPTLMGQLWRESSPLMPLVSILALVTATILVGSEIAVRRRLVGEADAFSRMLALVFAAGVAIPAVLMIYFVQTDLQHVADPFHNKVVILGLCGILPGIATALLFGHSGRSIYSWAYVGIPIAMTLTVAFLPEVREVGLGFSSLPFSYPTLGRVLTATAATLGMVLGIRHMVSRKRPEMTNWVLLSAGIWAWVLFASVCGEALSVRQHLCFLQETDIQRASVNYVVALFAVCWAIIGLVQFRRARRQKVNGEDAKRRGKSLG